MSALILLTGKPTGRGFISRPRCKWEDSIRIYLKQIGLGMKNWIEST